jgi:hypothetical protein
MFAITAEPANRLLRVTISGHVTAAEMRNEVPRLQSALKELAPGFRLLTDLTGLDRMEPDCTPLLRESMDQFNDAGVARVVRVIPDPHKDIGFSILSLFHYSSRIPIATCQTPAEADEILSQQ